METMAGLASLGVWMIVAFVVVCSVWSNTRRRESQQETLRRIVESGQTIDAALVDKMVGSVKRKSQAGRELKVAGIITVSVSPGLFLLGYFVSNGDPERLRAFIGISLLVGIVGVGIYVAGMMSARWNKQDENQDQNRA
jgi:Flp pilus assembly protein TadB